MLSDAQNTIWPVDPEKVSVVIPVLNAESFLPALLPALARQGLPLHRYLILDSQSDDCTAQLFRDFGATVVEVERATFNHGGTRQHAVDLRPNAEIIIMLTQDAIPQNEHSLLLLTSAFSDVQVGMAYGRQLPRNGSDPIERHARQFNYPATSEARSFQDRHRLGVKTVFCSNSFAAYRANALRESGGFPLDAFFAEDQLVAAKMLKEGWKLAYCGEAEVVHSHKYSILEEFRRYFDIGVFHGRNDWLLETYGRAEGEGMRFARSELAYLARRQPWHLPSAAARLVAKYAGYRLGKKERFLRNSWKTNLSMQPSYWK